MRPGSECWWRPQPASWRRLGRPARTRSEPCTSPAPRRFALANGIVEPRNGRAEVAEQADASVSKTDVRKDVRVRLPLSAPAWRCHPHIDSLTWPDVESLLWILLRTTFQAEERKHFG